MGLLAQNKNSNTSFDTETKFWPWVSGQGFLVARISKTQMGKCQNTGLSKFKICHKNSSKVFLKQKTRQKSYLSCKKTRRKIPHLIHVKQQNISSLSKKSEIYFRLFEKNLQRPENLAFNF